MPSCWSLPRRDCDACDGVSRAFLRSWGRAMGRSVSGWRDEVAKTSPRTLLFDTNSFWSQRQFCSLEIDNATRFSWLDLRKIRSKQSDLDSVLLQYSSCLAIDDQ